MSAGDDTDGLVCVSPPITDRVALNYIARLRKTAEFSFGGASRRRRGLVPPPEAFKIVFARKLELVLVRRIERAAAVALRRTIEERKRRGTQLLLDEQEPDNDGDEPGYIYCFHDWRDEPNVLKIGRTNRTPQRRLAEWHDELGLDREPATPTLALLFAYKTQLNELSERLIREALRCFRIHNRFNPYTDRELTEFYRMPNLLAASLFVRSVTAYVDRLWRVAQLEG